MASIENPIRPKKKSVSWFFPIFILMLIGFPFMRFAFSPLPVVPAEARCDQIVVALDGSHDTSAQQTIDADQLAELLSKSPRDRRPTNKVVGQNETMQVQFQMHGKEEDAKPVLCTLRFYAADTGTVSTGYLDIGTFSYRLSNPAGLEAQIRALCQPNETASVA